MGVPASKPRDGVADDRARSDERFAQQVADQSELSPLASPKSCFRLHRAADFATGRRPRLRRAADRESALSPGARPIGASGDRRRCAARGRCRRPRWCPAEPCPATRAAPAARSGRRSPAPSSAGSARARRATSSSRALSVAGSLPARGSGRRGRARAPAAAPTAGSRLDARERIARLVDPAPNADVGSRPYGCSPTRNAGRGPSTARLRIAQRASAISVVAGAGDVAQDRPHSTGQSPCTASDPGAEVVEVAAEHRQRDRVRPGRSARPARRPWTCCVAGSTCSSGNIVSARSPKSVVGSPATVLVGVPGASTRHASGGVVRVHELCGIGVADAQHHERIERRRSRARCRCRRRARPLTARGYDSHQVSGSSPAASVGCVVEQRRSRSLPIADDGRAPASSRAGACRRRE